MTDWRRYTAAGVATIGWAVTAVTLLQYDPVFAIATVLVGLMLWGSDRPAAAVAVTQVGIVTATPELGPLSVAILEVGPAVLLLAAVAADGLSLRTTTAAVLVGGALVGQTLVVLSYTGSLIAAGGAIVVVASLCSYAIHRYERVTLGLVDQS